VVPDPTTTSGSAPPSTAATVLGWLATTGLAVTIWLVIVAGAWITEEEWRGLHELVRAAAATAGVATAVLATGYLLLVNGAPTEATDSGADAAVGE
jgi:hypothetical protein